jgi:hypothetical protein
MERACLHGIMFDESALAPRRGLPLIGLRLDSVAHPPIPIAQEHQGGSYGVTNLQ